ncbi:DHH family phosphoesterase [Methylomarinum sp. Ch1-1]|uniref:DHH family phosphoesterase n=1 Tax=Methylomarinum roseum TaxID=3067653 RepID=A0AAU7NWW8_9GAMM|nr:DHH family phosphoesterase [Methylomarinum sp. Ch1-1]MDP4522837.1 DHH family phosphoesterase [Methylomarinum sp. Ch1-1]
MEIDVFNGDADGICALVQLRLDRPAQTQLVTGVKRDIELLKRVEVNDGDRVTVLDISLAKNRPYLEQILARGAGVFYVDHHQSGEIPHHPGLQTIIDTDAATCTSLLVNRYLKGKYQAWAVAAAFGDNLHDSALKAASALDLSSDEIEQLKDLGICINYNSYGSSLDDLHFAPDRLYNELCPFASPFDFIRENAGIHQQLLDGYAADMAEAAKISPEFHNEQVAVYILPDASWARRVSGVFGNHLANQKPERAHAVISHNDKGGFLVSVRAPLTNKTGADELCSLFATGGGRKAAAGINHLPQAELGRFIQALAEKYA